MMEAYSRDPMGDATPLSEYARTHLIDNLQAYPLAMVLLAIHAGRPVGIATCFIGFSTFAAKRVLNLSDFYVAPELRGQGIGRRLLSAVELAAREADCCKLALEVQQSNAVAREIYARFGLTRTAYAADADEGGSWCMSKRLV